MQDRGQFMLRWPGGQERYSGHGLSVMQDRDSSGLRNPKAKNVQGNSSKVWIVTYTAIVYIYIIVSNIYLHALLHIQVISGPEFIRKRAHKTMLTYCYLLNTGRCMQWAGHVMLWHIQKLVFSMNGRCILR